MTRVLLGRGPKPFKCPVLDDLTTDELLDIVRSTDDRDILVCPCQRRVWAEIARRGGVKRDSRPFPTTATKPVTLKR